MEKVKLFVSQKKVINHYTSYLKNAVQTRSYEHIALTRKKPMSTLEILFQQKPLFSIIARLEKTFLRFPHLPSHLMEFLLGILPAIFFALGILHAAIGALIIVTSSRLLPLYETNTLAVNPIYLVINGMLAVSAGIFMLLSFNEILHTTHSGWNRLLLINTISIVQSVLSILFSPQVFLGVVLYIFVTTYLTFEFKPYFRNESE